METYISLVQTHVGRDKVLKTVGYALSIISQYDPTYAPFSKLVSQCRSFLRFFDDVVVWDRTKKWANHVGRNN